MQPAVRLRKSPGGGTRQASERACAAAQLRHPSAGKRRRHPHHPGVARSRESVDDSTLHARLDAAHWQYRKPLGSALAERDAAGIVGDGAAGVRTGRRLSPPRRDLCSIERRTSRARRTARVGGDRGLPHAGVGRCCRMVRPLPIHASSLPLLLPQPPLPQVPRRGTGKVVEAAPRRVAARRIFTWSSHSPSPSPPSPSPTRRLSTTSSSAPPPQPCSPLPATPNVSASETSFFAVLHTWGQKDLHFILTCIAWFPAAASPRPTSNGLAAAGRFFSSPGSQHSFPRHFLEKP